MAYAGMTIQGMVHLLERLVGYVFYDPSCHLKKCSQDTLLKMCNIHLVSLAVFVINFNPFHSIEILEQEFLLFS
jgi:hypothetical protein